MLLRETEAMLREQGRFEPPKPAKPSRLAALANGASALAARKLAPVEKDPAATKGAARRFLRWMKPTTASRRSDLVVACMGIALGLTCALFPWYIFFNQEQFGVRAMKFSGRSEPVDGPIMLGDQPQRIGAPLSAEYIPTLQLDLFATGTVKDGANDDGQGASSLEDQPFPFEDPVFRLVHVANGRAMIEDDAGLFVVQRGSLLPDNSRVSAIEQRDGKWVLVTSAEKVVELGE